jgi:hypothetical protein
MDEELITFKVQYIVDTDPFTNLSIYPIPSRAPSFQFLTTVPLATQLGALLRLLGAPQRVRDR